MTELKRCPHCGKEQTYSNKNETIEYNNKSWRTCDHCLVEMPAWNTRPIEDELNARIAELTAKRDEWKNKFTDALACNDILVEQVEQLTAQLAEWKAVAERFAEHYGGFDEGGNYCVFCGEYTEQDGITINHAPDCPITLHRELVEKYKETK